MPNPTCFVSPGPGFGTLKAGGTPAQLLLVVSVVLYRHEQNTTLTDGLADVSRPGNPFLIISYYASH